MRDLRQRWTLLYALLTGILGVAVLVRAFAREAMPVDLPPLLLFTEVALIVAYFRVPIGREDAELCLDGPFLLGAALVGGPVLGGWVAFITGLATPIKPPLASKASERPPGRDRPPNRARLAGAATAILNGGRNVIALNTAWLAYQGLGGTLAPTTIDTPLAMALAILCVVYALVRSLWQLPVRVLQSTTPRQTLRGMVHLTVILVELLPLPVALLVAATVVRLGWSFFLLLSLVFIGLGAVMRQMLQNMESMRGQIDTLALTNQVWQGLADTPPEVDALLDLTRQLCQEAVTTHRFEVGLYPSQDRDAPTHVHIPVSVHEGEALPAMRVPINSLWSWLSQEREPQIAQNQAELDRLPFDLPPLDAEHAPQAALFVPLLPDAPAKEVDESPARPIGALVFTSPRPNAFNEADLARVALIGSHVGPAIAQAQEREEPRAGGQAQV